MDKHELKELIWEAKEHLEEAIDKLDTYVEATDDQNARAYLVDHLKIMASSEHGFLSRDLNLDDLLKPYRGGGRGIAPSPYKFLKASSM